MHLLMNKASIRHKALLYTTKKTRKYILTKITGIGIQIENSHATYTY